GSPNPTDWVEINFGVARHVDTAKLYFLDDGEKIIAPMDYELQAWDGAAWNPIPGQKRANEKPAGHRPEVVTFTPQDILKLRLVITHAKGGKSGLTEVEVWGDAVMPFVVAPPPAGNLAFNAK